MFTDLVGSTSMLDRLGDEVSGALMRTHFVMLRTAIARHGGREIKNLGDGLMVVFSDSAAAAACAAAMQSDVSHHNLANPNRPLAMRIGVHRGVAATEGDDLFGRPVVIAKRLCDRCAGGQVLVSAAVRTDLCDEWAPCDDLGAIELRGFAEPVSAAVLRWQSIVVARFDQQRPAASRTVRFAALRRRPTHRTAVLSSATRVAAPA